MSPKEKLKHLVESLSDGDLDKDFATNEIRGLLVTAFNDGICCVDDEALEHPECPSFEDWYEDKL